MKSIALTLALTTLLVSCNDGGSSSGNEGPVLSPQTVDKFEQELLSRRAGMVTLSKELGKHVYLEWNDSNGKFEPLVYTIDQVEKQTILKVDGDLIYTLTETPDSREVRKESIQMLLKEISEELPDGTVISTNGNILTVSFKADWSFDYESNGHQLNQGSIASIAASINLDDIRCSEKVVMDAKNSATVDGQAVKLPDTQSKTDGSCAPSLTKEQLKQIPLNDVSFCDETIGTNNENESNCTHNVDMSDLVTE